MYDFERGDIVYIRDFPFGKPTRIKGKVVGVLRGEYYNILLTNGLSKGKIKTVKFFEIRKEDAHDFAENKKRSIHNNSFKP